MSGVIFPLAVGSWPLAAVVFFASVMVPLLKIIALIYASPPANVRRHSRLRRRRIQRTRLPTGWSEFVGRWSMLDIYVITLPRLPGAVPGLATIQAGPAAVAFGAVVVLTMFAAMSFDPRLIWDPIAGPPLPGDHRLTDPAPLPRATVETPRRFPHPAGVDHPAGGALIGLFLAARTYYEQGRLITIQFQDRRRPGTRQDAHQHKGCGRRPDHRRGPRRGRRHVVATARLAREAARPAGGRHALLGGQRPGVGQPVSGLGTLLSGAYVGLTWANPPKTGATSGPDARRRSTFDVPGRPSRCRPRPSARSTLAR